MAARVQYGTVLLYGRNSLHCVIEETSSLWPRVPESLIFDSPSQTIWMSGNSVEQWFRALPPVTRWHFASVVIVTLAGNFGLVNPVSIALLQEQVFKKFEVS